MPEVHNMSDSTVSSHLDGIISDFEALKRSFETEEADTSAAPLTRRAANLRSSTSSSSQRLQELVARNSDSTSSSTSRVTSEAPGQRAVKSVLQRVEPSGARVPEPASRRTELSVDVSSRLVDSTPGSGIARFGLRRPDTTSRRAEPAPAASRLPEQPQRKADHPSPVEVPSRRPEVSEDSTGPAASEPQTPSEHKTQQSPLSDVSVKLPDKSDIISSYSSAMSEPAKPVPGPPVNEKPSMDFSYVGIDAILEQMRRKAMKQGFELNIMVVGQSGLGKSTLMNTLFKSKVSRRSTLASAEERIPKTVEIKSISHDIEEKGVRMKLTVIDTPGFGDHINNENCWQPIMRFINEQYERYLQEEININRKTRIPDSRVHCCIYFIPPTGHCLRPLDVEFMRRLSKVVNIVPVIAKADTLTLEERDFFKKKIREELQANDIDVYPQKEFDEDAEDRAINERIRGMIPFAVVGSDQECQVNGRRLLGRKTKWGTIEVENISHCEFSYLRDLLIRTHMQNIKDITSSIHYEAYRVRRLNESNVQSNGVTEHEATTHEM
ncbi:neuronal-specific septin-3-like isoform X3 [Scleropages formosus]|uniref:Septin 9 n=1 Tax=Scleropages formosus TaxID=113540 RepID=A0A8C9R601_SCLFO|nr:neuronal-specific septin-3-like isoform X3 [Scleropages formosus]